MPKLTMQVIDRQGMFTTGIDKRMKKLIDAERVARNSAAAVATQVTRTGFHYVRPVVAPRPGRASTGSHFSKLTWRSTPDGVVFDTGQADAESKHWIIQEIGTGQRAVMRVGGLSNPRGRPAKGATHIRTVRSQKGRRLPGGLVFASNGQYSPVGSAEREQIFRASQVTGVPLGAPGLGHRGRKGS